MKILCIQIHFLNLSNHHLLTLKSLKSASIFLTLSTYNTLTSPQIITLNTVSTNCYSLINTNNNISIYLIICNHCFISTYNTFLTSAWVIFSMLRWNWSLMCFLFSLYFLFIFSLYFLSLFSLFLELYHVSRLPRLGTQNSLGSKKNTGIYVKLN